MYEQTVWNLGDILNGNDTEVLSKNLRRRAAEFAGIRDTLDGDISHERFTDCISRLEGITREVSRIGGHASLSYAEDTQSEKAAATIARTSQMESEVANHRRQFEDFMAAIREDRPPRGDGEEGLKALEIVLAVYRSARERRPVELPPG